MQGKSVKIVVGLIVLAVIVTIGVIAITPKEKTKDNSNDSSTTSMNGMDMSSQANTMSDGTKAPQVDLTNESSVAIDIKDFAYSKPNIKIKKGTTVTWTNQDSIQHNAMRSHDNDSSAHDAPTAEEVKPTVFAGPLLKQGESYSFTFNEIGAEAYHCAPHPYMKGIVTVVE